METTSPHSTTETGAYEFYSKPEYFQKLNDLLSTASEASRILLTSMTFEPEYAEVDELVSNLEAAAHRGADISIGIDAHTFLLHHGRPGPLMLKGEIDSPLSEPFKRKKNLINILRGYPNVNLGILNTPASRFNLAIAGRAHLKTAIINDAIFVGGCNLDRPEDLDMMIGWRNKSVADSLHAKMSRVITAPSARQALHDTDQQIAIDEGTRILVDAGVPGKSLIFDESLKLIDAAEDWLTITCQYFPGGITARHLAAARKRGVHVEILFSHPDHHGVAGGFGQKCSIALERLRNPKEMFKDGLSEDDPMLHAKLLACDKGLMIGSHNYVRAGVRLGTAEMTFQSDDEALARQAASKIKHMIKEGSITNSSEPEQVSA